MPTAVPVLTRLIPEGVCGGHSHGGSWTSPTPTASTFDLGAHATLDMRWNEEVDIKNKGQVHCRFHAIEDCSTRMGLVCPDNLKGRSNPGLQPAPNALSKDRYSRAFLPTVPMYGSFPGCKCLLRIFLALDTCMAELSVLLLELPVGTFLPLKTERAPSVTSGPRRDFPPLILPSCLSPAGISCCISSSSSSGQPIKQSPPRGQ